MHLPRSFTRPRLHKTPSYFPTTQRITPIHILPKPNFSLSLKKKKKKKKKKKFFLSASAYSFNNSCERHGYELSSVVEFPHYSHPHHLLLSPQILDQNKHPLFFSSFAFSCGHHRYDPLIQLQSLSRLKQQSFLTKAISMAAGGKLYGAPNITLLLQNERLPSSSDVLDSLWPHASNPTFPGSKSMVNFERVSGCTVTDRPYMQGVEKEENVEEEYEACFHQAGKKRRLTSEQVQFLEKNFEVENKLEPERKVQLAKELGLQPRQVAIWFQNRRARFKTKQLEKDYGTLKASYDKLKSDTDTLMKENDKLKEEVNSLKKRLIGREKEKEDSHKSPDNDPEDAEAVNSLSPHRDRPGSSVLSENRSKIAVDPAGITMCKQEEANSAKSDVFDSEDAEANHQSSMGEPGDSSHAFEPEHSDFSQDEEDNLSRNLLSLPYCFPKVEDGCYEDPPETCNNFGFPVEDQTFCFWSY